MRESRKDGVLVLLGGNKLHQGIVEKCRAARRKIVVVDWNETPELRGDLHLRCDVKDSANVVSALREANIADVWLAYTSIDLAVPSVVAIHRECGLQTPSGDIWSSPLSKQHMVDCWKRDDLLNRYSVVVNADCVNAVVEATSRSKAIVKPNVASSSRGITVLPVGSGASACEAALRRAQEASFDRQALVEEFFEGREFTVEMLGDRLGNVGVYAISVKYHSANAGANKIAVKLHYNSVLYSDETYSRIAEYARKCYRSAGLNTSFGHLEILMNDQQELSPVEIGARSTGFVCSPLVDVASGRDYLEDYACVLRGESVNNDIYQATESGMYFFYDFPEGFKCSKKSNLSTYLPPKVRSLYSDCTLIQEGHTYGRIDSDSERWGFEILVGPREALTIGAVEKAESQLIADLRG